jgi:hypothetical protein
MTDTPETDELWAAWADEKLPSGQFRYGPADLADHARRLERERNDARKELKQIDSLFFGGFLEDTAKDGLAWRLFDEVMAMRKERNAYAETLRVIATANSRSHHRAAFTELIRERHPELAP